MPITLSEVSAFPTRSNANGSSDPLHHPDPGVINVTGTADTAETVGINVTITASDAPGVLGTDYPAGPFLCEFDVEPGMSLEDVAKGLGAAVQAVSAVWSGNGSDANGAPVAQVVSYVAFPHTAVSVQRVV